ncbi:hypothetical protein [Actinomyces trachealis]|uniref:hypothetical protein n=1 Tax=Actinomyces trachealis TaxID=2763540 RepID=UPI0018928D58|nr:hypothetical protein [Actinomyces trachealis]
MTFLTNNLVMLLVACALRERLEETGVTPEVPGLSGVVAGHEITFPNGDRCTFMDISMVGSTYREQVTVAHVGDDESTEVG